MTEQKQRQVNVRLDEHLLKLIDTCRVEAHSASGGIPTRSDVIRDAIHEYLERRGKLPSGGS
ncbi:ribbon-helix-helix domain-containing protein [Natronocella acetinitrilica]|uniref:ribbon-helix-helix domain-containing protein n=1 Tax=Natronocella acetinitrilica TaxID=414046 RepID=UPI00344C5BE7